MQKKVHIGDGQKKEYTEAEKQACSLDALMNGEECEACQFIHISDRKTTGKPPVVFFDPG